MKKIILQLAVFILIVISCDFIIGKSLKKLYFNSSSPEIANYRYTIESASQAILIYGSSRAQSHYIPDTITKFTGLNCYNCGISGQGMGFTYIQISEMLKRHQPKLILLDLTPSLILDESANERLNVLNPYYEKDTIIQNAIIAGSAFNKLKFYSYIYPYNGMILTLLKNCFISLKRDSNKGYVPLLGRIDTSMIKIGNFSNSEIPERQLSYLKSIIKICHLKNATLKILISPIYAKNNVDNIILKQIKKLADSNDIDFFDYSSDNSYFAESNLFRDRLHLNSTGAALYSEIISKKIELELYKKNHLNSDTTFSRLYH